MKILFSVITTMGLLCLFSAINLKTVNAQTAGFVSTQGRSLQYGGQELRLVGVNRYNLLTTGGSPYIGCGADWSEAELDAYFAEMSSQKIGVVRFWLFQNFIPNGNFSRMDFVVTLAKKYNIFLLPVFENHWSACTLGGTKTPSWYQSEYKGTYGYPKTLKAFIQTAVTRYKNTPQIMAWQVMNEAESTDARALESFAWDVAGFIKSIDVNHLVSFGTLGSSQNGMEVYRELHANAAIDILEFHDYDYHNSGDPIISKYLGTRFADSVALNKPLIVGEVGIEAGCTTCISETSRAQVIGQKMSDFFKNGGAAYLIWSYRDKTFDPAKDRFAFTKGDPLSKVVVSQASNFSSTPSSTTDANGDGLVDTKDFDVWKTNYNKKVTTGKTAADFNNDGLVDGVDYALWAANYK